MLESFIQWLLDRFRDIGYPGIVLLMAVESSIVPLPSELVMPPAGYLAAKGELSLPLVILCGVLGSVVGALANYGLAAWLGRAFVHRVGRYVLVSERNLERSERFFATHGEISTFVARLLPVIRHLISLPAGLARMPIPRFMSFTALGSGVWCTVLTVIGWTIGRKESVLMGALNVEVRHEAARAMTIIVPALVVLTIAYIAWTRRRTPQV
ncbi:MAG TPA: DedA family protein [Gemmatimonadales bacterium]|jgi:membrane protein DedA with SNARE-associated domain|nr:DedA family protein [Gemmatimonadales bacterium]